MKPRNNRTPCATYDKERFVDIPGTKMPTIIWWNSLCGNSSEDDAFWALRLSTAARRETSVGEIVNLMSVDAQKLQHAPIFLHLLWSAPLTIGLCMYFLWQQLGPSVLAGLLIVLILISLNWFLAGKICRHADLSIAERLAVVENQLLQLSDSVSTNTEKHLRMEGDLTTLTKKTASTPSQSCVSTKQHCGLLQLA
ncbi:hypothetical protein LSAT2_009314 [Lamellibrachia satsuma]|nr:hypothetical protein LSAT2_009314 [Lamellibrachia satsuma]